MLNTNTNRSNQCLSDCPFVFIARPNDPGNGNIRVVMLEITEEEEKQLDNNISLSLTRGGLSFNINPDFCLAYGEFDISPNSESIETFDKADWFYKMNIRHFVPSDYDYNTHTRSSIKCYDTSDIRVYLPYLYACMNKPKRIVIFKEYVDIVSLRRAKRKAEKQKEWNAAHKDSIKNKRIKRKDAKRKAKLGMLTFK